LNEGFVFGKYGIVLIHSRVFASRVLFDHFLHFYRNFLVLATALYTFIQIIDAFRDIRAKHVIHIDLFATTVNDLVADLGQ
jgi:hypothetical protein